MAGTRLALRIVSLSILAILVPVLSGCPSLWPRSGSQRSLVSSLASPADTVPPHTAGESAAVGPPVISPDEASRLAARQDRDKNPQCVDSYAWAVLNHWPAINSPGPPDARQKALAAYNDSLQKLIASGLKYQRLDFRTGLPVQTPDGRSSRVAIAFHGFPWQPGDFDQIQIAEGQGAKKLNNYWQRTGLGVPLIAVRQRPESRDFLGPVIPFAATAVLRPGNGNAAHSRCANCRSICFHG